MTSPLCFFFFFFNDTATTEIYTLSLHDALPISFNGQRQVVERPDLFLFPEAGFIIFGHFADLNGGRHRDPDRKSTRLNSSHLVISYAVFCLKKKKNMLYPLLTLYY